MTIATDYWRHRCHDKSTSWRGFNGFTGGIFSELYGLRELTGSLQDRLERAAQESNRLPTKSGQDVEEDPAHARVVIAKHEARSERMTDSQLLFPPSTNAISPWISLARCGVIVRPVRVSAVEAAPAPALCRLPAAP
jgi:hypothetical protein